jgi:hypothetical protein
MKRYASRQRILRASASLIATLGLTAQLAWSHPAQHGPEEGHLLGTGAWGKVRLVGKLAVSNAADDRISDVAAKGNYAYLGAFAQDTCEIANRASATRDPDVKALPGEKVGQIGRDGGVYVIDISNPAAPREVGFIPAAQDTYVGEGVQVINLTTPNFNGDVLVLNNEGCGKNYKGGFSLWNVTNPLKPVKLSENMGDFTIFNDNADIPNTPHDSNQVHSVFAWDAGSKAYVIITDDDELGGFDLDIVDITNPKKPVLVAEFDPRKSFPISTKTAKGKESFLHDMVVKQIGQKFYALLSYWDSGWLVFDVTNPAAPKFVTESEYADIDPVLLATNGVSLQPEGNGHQAEWTYENRYVIGTDEDFSPFEAKFNITSGSNLGEYPGGEFGFTKPIADTLPDGTLNGPVVFGGYGCAADAAQIPSPSILDGFTLPGEEKILVLSRGPVNDPAANFEACFFEDKVAAAAAKGYDAVVVANHHSGSGNGTDPDATLCGSGANGQIMGVCIGHRAYHYLFNTEPAYGDYATSVEPQIGSIGERVRFTTIFDGWGYVHLYDYANRNPDGTMKAIAQYAIPESQQRAFASGYGDLTVHEVATDPTTNRAYLSYYAGGFRALSYGPTGFTEIGGYLDPAGNDFWGVEVWNHPATGKQYVLGSDLDSGLWVFEILP